MAAVAAAGLLAVGYGTAQAGVDPTADKGSSVREAKPAEQRAEDDDFESTLELRDGRKLHVRLVEGTGVQERHTDGESPAWSEWRTIHKTKKDRCQGVQLEEEEGTVSLIADFGVFCYDGEPPEDSLAGVSTGDLTDWDFDVQKQFAGWHDVTFGGWGDRVVFVVELDDGLYSLRWTKGEGFGKVQKTKS